MARPTVNTPRDGGVINIHGYLYHLVGPVLVAKANQFAPPTRTGDPEPSDQQYLSEVAWTDLTGGLGVINMDEREFPDKFTDATLWTLTRKMVVLPPKANQVTNGPNLGSPESFCVTHSRQVYLFNGADVIRVSLDNGLPSAYWYNNASGTGGEWVNTGSSATRYSPGPIISRPIIWKNDLYYATINKIFRYNTATNVFAEVTDVATGFSFSGFQLFVYDDSVGFIQADGTIKSFNDITSGNVVTLTSRGMLKEFSAVNGVEIGRNASGEPAPVIATDTGMFILDWFSNKTYTVGIYFRDRAPLSGMGLVEFDGDLWFGKGANAFQMANGVRIKRGPNMGDGLVAAKQGNIVDLTTPYDNFLVGVMDGSSRVGSAANRSSLLAFNRRGWHVLYTTGANTITTHFDDNFNRADSTNTPGGGWSVTAGTWGINGNRLYKSAGSGASADAITQTVGISTGYAVQLRMATQDLTVDSAAIGLLVQYYDVNNYAVISRSGSTGGTPYILSYRAAGSTTNYFLYGSTARHNDVVKAVVLNGQISVYVNGIYYGGYPTALSTDKVGVMAYPSAVVSARFDDFKCYSLPTSISRAGYIPSGDPTTPSFLLFHQFNSNGFYYLKLYDLTDNPEQYAASDYAPAGELTLPWFDAGFSAVQKTGIQVEVRARDCTANRTITVYYQKDDDDSSWTQLRDVNGSNAVITTDGVTTLYLDADRLGTLFYNARFKVDLVTNDASVSPVLIYLKLVYLKELRILRRYSVEIDLSRPTPDNREPVKAIQQLNTDVESRLIRLVAYKSGPVAYGASNVKEVLVLNASGTDGDGALQAGRIRLELLEVRPQ